jgi:ABC-type sugar transport system ATPase subunit
MTVAAGTAHLLEVRDLRKSFSGVEVLHGVGFTLAPGQVLGLVGENGSGKSTTMNILGGVLHSDGGSMQLDGRPYTPEGPRAARDNGIAFIHQELNLFKNLSIAENLFIGDFPRLGRGWPLINRAATQKRTTELLAAVDLEVSPTTLVSSLSQGERQLVEVAKALRTDSRIIIFDEPTTSLTTHETERLFEIIRRLKAQRIAIIYISHILGDVMRLCDDIVVLRDGAVVEALPTAEFTPERLISSMVGRAIDQLFPPRIAGPVAGQPVLEVRGLTQPGTIKDITFSLQPGEVLGVSGLMGAGRSEMARILFGLDPYRSGDIIIAGEKLDHVSPLACIARGMAFLTEDRRGEGLLMDASIVDNIALPSLASYATGWAHFVNRKGLADDVRLISRAVRINARDIDRTLAKQLSGGNQQKVVIAKWLLRKPRVMILDEPTRGIDVGAKYEVYKIINQLAADGTGILLISSEIEELTSMCDRILVMRHGEIRGVHLAAEFDREQILKSAIWEGLKELV